MNVQLRTYTESDKDDIQKLFENLLREIALYNSLRKKIPSPNYADYHLKETLKLVEKDKGIVLVAECSEKLVGYAIGIMKEYTKAELFEFHAKQQGYIADVYVERAYRSRGVGIKLIGEIEKYFRTKGCEYCEINVVLANKHAHSLYQTLGFIDHDVNMIKSL